jgi:hypothetical protein
VSNPTEPNAAVRSANIFDDDRSCEVLAHPLGHDSPDNIGGAARRERHDHGYGARRIGLRPPNPTECRKRDSARCQIEKSAAWQFHDVPLNEFADATSQISSQNYTDLRGSRKGLAAALVQVFGRCARKSPGREDDDVI